MLYLKPLSAEEAMTKMVEVAKTAFAAVSPINWNLTTGITGLMAGGSVTSPSQIISQPSLATILQLIKGKAHIWASNVSLANQQNSIKVAYEQQPRTTFAQIAITAPAPAQIGEILAAVEANYNVTPYIDLVTGSEGASQGAALQLRERSVADLEREVNRLAGFLSEITEKNTEQMRTQQAELEARHREKSDQLDKEHKAKLDAIEARRAAAEAELDNRRKQLDEKIAGFETKEAKYVRRGLMDRLDALLSKSETLELSGGTRKKRRIIHVVALVTSICSGSLMVLAVKRFLTADAPDWHVLGPMAAWSVMFFGTLVYYLKWNDRWFREHAETEFASKRYQADVVRASWIAELVSEWGDEGKNSPPKELIEAYTRNLFRNTGPVRETEHPFSQLTGLLKNVKRIQIGEGKIAIGDFEKGKD